MLLRAAGAITLLFVFSSNTYAFSLGDHAQITLAAAAGIEHCLGRALPDASVQALIAANRGEDLNLLRKWTRYSHFYNPERPFDSLRLNSRDRILNIEKQLDACPGAGSCDKLLGKALHHVQDMASPPHVVVVNHLWTDGFEELDVPILPSFDFPSCDALLVEALSVTITGVHQSTAEETWALSRRGSLQVVRFDRPRARLVRIPLIAFWVRGTRGGWGEYGAFGNTFGKESLSTAIGELWISPVEYSRFKQARLQAALRASQLVLARAWLLGFGPGR